MKLKQENQKLKDCIASSEDFTELKVCSVGVSS